MLFEPILCREASTRGCLLSQNGPFGVRRVMWSMGGGAYTQRTNI